MSIRVRVEEDPAYPAGGHALVRISGLSAPPSDARFAIEREGWQRGVLGPDGWQVGAALLTPDRVSVEGGEVVLAVGPSVVDVVEAGPVRFRLPGAGLDVAVFWPDLTTSHAGAAPPPPPVRAATPVRPPAPLRPPAAGEDATVVVAPPPVVEPAPVRAPLAAEPARGRGLWPLLLVLLLFAAAGAGGVYWWMEVRERPQLAETTPAPAPAPPAAPGPDVAPPATVAPPPVVAPAPPPVASPAPATPAPPDRATPSLADLTVPQVIARAPGVAEIAAEAAARAARGLHEDALLLWEAAARLGHAPSLTALGRLYDPVGFQPGRPFRSPDPRQAARYYQQAARAGDPGAEAPRAALREWLQAQAARGDTLAPLTLQDFWP
jgi:hypothetical protein